MAGPWLLPVAGAVIGGGINAAKGGSFGDIAKGALLGGATGGVASGIGSAIGLGATTTAASGAKTAAAVLSPQEKLLQAAVAPSTSSAASASKLLVPKYSLMDSGAIVQNFADKPSNLENMMKYANYARTGAGLVDDLTKQQPKAPTQFLQPMPQPSVAQIPQDDLYQQLLKLSQQG